MVNTSVLLPHVNETGTIVVNHVASAVNTISQASVPVFSPDQAPLWLNILIYMQMYQWFLLAAILPTIYLVIVKLFGFPLLQRFNQEVIIMLYPTKAKFFKLVTEDEPYFATKSGVYWRADPLVNVNSSHKFKTEKGDKTNRCLEEMVIEGKPTICGMTRRQHKRIENNIERNYNTIQIFTHATNQAVYDMERKKDKTHDITTSEHKLKPVPRHHVWIMKNFWQHFHRHWEIITDEAGTIYELRAVKQRQQFSISLWHTLGITQLKVQQVEEMALEGSESSSGGKMKQQLVTVPITNQFVVSQISFTKSHTNYSATAVYRAIRRMKKIEDNLHYWASGSMNMKPIIVMIGAFACVGLVFYLFLGGNHQLGPMPK